MQYPGFPSIVGIQRQADVLDGCNEGQDPENIRKPSQDQRIRYWPVFNNEFERNDDVPMSPYMIPTAMSIPAHERFW